MNSPSPDPDPLSWGWSVSDGARTPYKVFTDRDIYEKEQRRVFCGPTWTFVALTAELPNPGDYKSTFVGEMPVVVTHSRNG